MTEVEEGEIIDCPSAIDHLPAPLLTSVIAFLPIKEAARTSILSHTWRFKWKSISRLDLDSRSLNMKKSFQISKLPFRDSRVMKYHGNNMASIVQQIFSSHRGPILSCRISHYLIQCRLNVDRWINFLNERGIQKLLLSCHDYIEDEFSLPVDRFPFEFPPGVFRSTSLKFLGLSSCLLLDASPFLGCNNLETLKLDRVILTCESLIGIIFNCGHLESLILRRCRGINDIMICDTNLKILKLIQFDGLNEVNIKAPNLTTLVINGLRCNYMNAIDAPKLRFFSTCGFLDDKEEEEEEFSNDDDKEIFIPNSVETNMDLFARCIGLSREHRPTGSSTFENLQKLIINVDMYNSDRAKEVAFALRICLHLQELDIRMERQYSLPEPFYSQGYMVYDELWQKEDSHDCVAFHLKIVRLRGFRGEYIQLEFARYLITNATMLKKMIIWCHDDCSKRGAEATRGLLSAPRASLDVHIVLEPGPRYLAGDFEAWESTLR
ncbi:F-box/FBD/LRR-repeat protein At1g13570-like [Tasmannia lanceolata]|uniref:F-box/FBD/LRR-repeat protein At1g13570-like n=1 Tax=Tasmannia lanceolata TaxID=3420 RepID=UPI0040632DED